MYAYTLLTEKTRKAQKNYFCSHCAEPILKSEKYVYTTGSIEGRMQADSWHVECRAAVNSWSARKWDSWVPGSYRRGTVKNKWDRP